MEGQHQLQQADWKQSDRRWHRPFGLKFGFRQAMNGMIARRTGVSKDLCLQGAQVWDIFKELNKERNATWGLELAVKYQLLSRNYDLYFVCCKQVEMPSHGVENDITSDKSCRSECFAIIDTLLFHLSFYCYMAEPS
jgi:hypothetical protein